MRILGIDYGRKKIGLALAESVLAEPYLVLRFESLEEAVKKIMKVVAAEKIEKIIVGVSEGNMGEESKEFSLSLSKTVKIPVETIDETLTTHDAQKFAQEAGVKRVKRKALEDAYAATLLLQNYLDSNRHL